MHAIELLSCLVKRTQRMDCRRHETTSTQWWVSIPTTLRQWGAEKMVLGSWSHGCCMPRYNCTRPWRHSHRLGCFFLAVFWIFSTFTNLPQSNLVRVGRSLPAFIYVFGHQQGNREFEQDHAFSHKSWLATYWFEQLFFHFSVMIWPVINPIEHFLNVLEKGVKAHQPLLNYVQL